MHRMSLSKGKWELAYNHGLEGQRTRNEQHACNWNGDWYKMKNIGKNSWTEFNWNYFLTRQVISPNGGNNIGQVLLLINDSVKLLYTARGLFSTH